MIISCDECNSSFSVNDSLIKDKGSKVRCSKCDSVFIAYPQSTEDIEEELTLESDDQMLGEEELGLDDLDSDFSDFLEDEEDELSLNDYNNTSDAETASKPDGVLEETEGELELDLDFDQGDDLPDLSDLDDAELTMDAAESELEDLNFELESATDAELDLEDGDGLDLSDLGLEEEDIAALENSSTEQDAALEVGESDALDLSDLEAALDDESALEETAKTDPEKFGLEVEKDEPGVEEITAADLEVAASDELDLSDLDLDIEDASVSEEATAAETEELDVDLATEPVSDTDTAAGDELDLSDLSGILEDEKAPAAETQPDELEFDLDLESDALTGADEPAAVANSGEVDELDLSDLEDFMKTEDAPAASAANDDSAQDLDLDLDFQMDDSAPAIETAADSQADDELGFSDLENLLESDETPSVEATDSLDAEDLDLEFDLDEPSAVAADSAAAGDPGAVDQDDDFLDIEQLLAEGEDSGLELGDEVTDLTLEMDAGPKSASNGADNGADAELELDFDLESELQATEDEDEDLFDTGDSSEYQLESNLLASDEANLLEKETEFQDSSATSVLSPDGFAADESPETNRADGATYVLTGDEGDLPIVTESLEPEYLDPEPVVYETQKTRSKKPLLVVGLLFLLGIGVFIIPNMLGIKIPYISDIKIPYLSDPNVKIPYLSDWLNPAPQDVAGNLKLTPLGNTINGKFVDNDAAGQLFVIQGQIKNDYDHPRSYIKVTGKLLLKGKKIAKTATVYCGNVLNNSDLTAMNITAINKKLNNRSGAKRSNLKVKTGKRVPFMIVFDKLPRNLDEYTVEVAGSSL